MSERLKNLLQSVARQEQEALHREFLAPCVRGGRLRARVGEMIYTFKPLPADFEGWGIFLPVNTQEAELLEEASLFQTSDYLQLLRAVRLRLAQQLGGQTWLAYAANESDFAQRFGAARPVLIHLVSEGAAFEQVIARNDGSSFFFEEIDRRSDPDVARTLRGAAANHTLAENLQFAHLTPEMRVCYELATQPYTPPAKRRASYRQQTPVPQSDEQRLAQALQTGGGSLEGYTDRGDYWVVEWTSRNGERHSSAIGKDDFTVISSGICLSGRDRDFDLQSLVGVIDAEV